MANRIRLSDNTEFNAVWCGVADGVLNIELSDTISITAAAAVFSDASRTASIAYLIGGQTAATFAQYTTLLDIHRDRWNGRVLIQLEKAAVTDMIGEIELEIMEMEEQ